MHTYQLKLREIARWTGIVVFSTTIVTGSFALLWITIWQVVP